MKKVIISMLLGAGFISGCVSSLQSPTGTTYTIKQPTLEWEKTLGGKREDGTLSIIKSRDNRYIVVGATKSRGMGSYDGWIIKIDERGNKIWEKTFGKKDVDWINSITEAVDYGYILVGHTTLNKNSDGWIIKINESGKKIWEKRYGGKYLDKFNDIVKTRDGNYIAVGLKQSKDKGDGWIVKLDKRGNKIWEKTYGSRNFDVLKSVTATNDGFIAVGFIQKDNNGKDRDTDVWILKFDKKGNKIWEKVWGGKNIDYANKIIKTNDNNYLIIITTALKSGNKIYSHIQAVKIDVYGNKLWENSFGGTYSDIGYSAIQSDDNFVIVGMTSSKGKGNYDGWIIKIDKYGKKIWDKTFGGEKNDGAKGIIQTDDRGYIVVGSTESKGNGKWDGWIFKVRE